MAVIYLAGARSISGPLDQRHRAQRAAILLATPLAVVDVGFWLTFGASAAILCQRAVVGSGGRTASAAVVDRCATAAAELALPRSPRWSFSA